MEKERNFGVVGVWGALRSGCTYCRCTLYVRGIGDGMLNGNFGLVTEKDKKIKQGRDYCVIFTLGFSIAYTLACKSCAFVCQSPACCLEYV